MERKNEVMAEWARRTSGLWDAPNGMAGGGEG
jgi:hypothetical protein